MENNVQNRKIPKMIIFDYGHTLTYEEKWDGVKGEKALLKYAVSNKNNLMPEQVCEFADDLFLTTNAGRRNGLEVHEHQFQKFLYEYLQIKVNLPPVKLEEIFWDNASPAHAMPYMIETLDYLRKNKIRTGVISNISFSGKALKNRLNRIFPDNRFEFIIASSEYIFRKPNKMLFELALKKANLAANDVWYCGDSVEFDVSGASSAGIFPVWYESEIESWYIERGKQKIPECEHLHITDWRELIDVLEGLK
ncbi:MAG: HAD family hydrolase [Oscillospiraceae bacterium]|nr:HAD family hydrolase [Oscillospiraceae bacterium]